MHRMILSIMLFSLSASVLAQTAHDRNAQGNDDYQRSLEIRRQNDERRNAERQREQELRNADYWGAYVYLAKGNWRFFVTTNLETENMARQRALARCKEETGRDDCEVVMTFKNTCAGIAVDNNHYFTATGGSEKKAKQNALDACKRTGSTLCSNGAIPYCSDYYSAYNKSRPWF